MIELTGHVISVDHEKCMLHVSVDGRGLVKLPVLRGQLAEFAAETNAEVVVRVEKKGTGQVA